MAFSVSRNSFKDGDYLRSDFILSADFGFGCAGGQQVATPEVVGRARGDKKFRCHVL
jgi:hypothetical protein